MPVQTSRATVTAGTLTLQSKPGASLRVGGLLASDSMMSDQGGYHYKNTHVPGQVKLTHIHTSASDLDAVRTSRDITVLYETDTGKKYQIPGAVPIEIGELANGEVDITYEGPPAQKMG